MAVWVGVSPVWSPSLVGTGEVGTNIGGWLMTPFSFGWGMYEEGGLIVGTGEAAVPVEASRPPVPLAGFVFERISLTVTALLPNRRSVVLGGGGVGLRPWD